MKNEKFVFWVTFEHHKEGEFVQDCALVKLDEPKFYSTASFDGQLLEAIGEDEDFDHLIPQKIVNVSRLN